MSAVAAEPLPRFAPVEHREQLPAVIRSLERATAHAIEVRRDALAHGPREIRLLAAYQLGVTHVAIVVRARCAIFTPPDLAGDPAAADRFSVLHVSLEPLVASHLRDAVAAFEQARAIANEIPAGEPADPVVRALVPLIDRQLETIEVR